jgi:hypothetical protein
LFRQPLTRYLFEQIEPFAGYGDVVAWMRQVRNETLSDRIGHLAVEVLSLTAFEPKRSFGGFTRPAYRPYSQTARWKGGILPQLHE